MLIKKYITGSQSIIKIFVLFITLGNLFYSKFLILLKVYMYIYDIINYIWSNFLLVIKNFFEEIKSIPESQYFL